MAEEKFEVLERCVACDCPVRVRRLTSGGKQLGDVLSIGHVYYGATYCLDCLEKLPVLLGLATRLGFPGLQEISFN